MATTGIVQFSTISKSKDFRLEAEFYVLQVNNFSKMLSGTDAISFVQYGTSDELNEEHRGYPILRLNEFEGTFVGEPAKYCDLIDNEGFEGLRLKKNDILICRTNGNPNYVGKTAIVMEDTNFAFASYLFRIRTISELNPCVLTIFLNSRYGRAEVDRYSLVSNQTNFSPAKFRQIEIPIFSKNFQEKISSLVEGAWVAIKESKKIYEDAERVFLEEIGLSSYIPKHELSFVVKLSETLRPERIDANYFHPKYQRLLSGMNNKLMRLGDVISYSKGCEVGSDAYLDSGVPFIRVSNMTKFGLVDNDQKFISKQTYDKLKLEFKPKLNDILLTKDASIGIATVVEEEQEQIISSGILRIKPKIKINTDYLVLVLNSIIVQQQIERDCGGSIINHWRIEQIENTLIPILSDKTQSKIGSRIQEAILLRKKARNNLKEAMSSVEEYIEKKGSI